MSILEQDTVLVSKNAEGNTVVHLPMTRANNIEGLGRLKETSYAVNDIVFADSNQQIILKCITAGKTTNSELNIASVSVGGTITDGTVVWLVLKREYAAEVEALQKDVGELDTQVAGIITNMTNEINYKRPAPFTCTKTTVTIPADTKIKIGANLYTVPTDTTLQLSDVVAAGSRAGKDIYIYACQPASGSAPVLILSMNSTVPSGYNADNSRKIGGFHCLCVAVGTISGHALSGYVAGDILPRSLWDLLDRPESDPEGMVKGLYSDTWFDIYLSSWDGTKLVSTYGGIIADGTSSKKWHGEACLEQYLKQKKRLPWRHEFQMEAKGSNEETNIAGSADPNTTGGHKDTASRRMISDIGLEDACGVMWQWSMDLGFAGGSGWTESVYNSAVDSKQYGQTYGTLFRLFLGGYWGDGAACGSRCAHCSNSSASVDAHNGSRGSSEPRKVQLS